MSLSRSHPIALLVGAVAGSVVYRFLVADWYFALSIAALYAGVAYFYSAFDIPVLGTHIEFVDRADKIGYAVGLFGLSVSPVAFGQYAGVRRATLFGIVVWEMGILLFLVFAMTAARQQ